MQTPRCLCGNDKFTTIYTYGKPPAGEVKFDFGATPYHREIRRCTNCGHFLSVHDIDMTRLYSGHYVDATYGADGLKRAFDRINSLPPERSDNVGRVERIVEFFKSHCEGEADGTTMPSVLDVGSGLCVFLFRLHHLTGWPCTALDPDRRAADHASHVAGVTGVCADFMRAEDLGSFDLITFNKVLEHVRDPISMLARAHRHLRHDGIVYVELPDGEAASVEGDSREEYFIDHHHVFSPDSTRELAQKAGFSVVAMERLKEPSTKFTIRAFFSPRPGAPAAVSRSFLQARPDHA